VKQFGIDKSLGGRRRKAVHSPLDIALKGQHEDVIVFLALQGVPFKGEFTLLDSVIRRFIVERTNGSVSDEDITKLQNYLQVENGKVEQRIRSECITGTIPIGFPDRPRWKSICEGVLHSLQWVRKGTDELKILEENITKGNNEINEIEAQIKELQNRKEELKINVFQWTQEKQERIFVENFLNSKIDSLHVRATQFEGTENAMLEELSEQLKNDPTQLEDLCDLENPKPKLSLVFNAIGMDKKDIDALADVNGFEFIHSKGETWSFIDDFGKRKDLNYHQRLICDGKFLSYSAHCDECATCGCESVEDLVNLLEEHELPYVELLNEFKNHLDVTGRRLLGVTRSDIKHFGISQEAISLVKFLQKLHQEAEN